MPTFINMKSISPGHVEITLDLSLYIEGYEEAYDPQITSGDNQKAAVAKFKKLSGDLSEQINGIPGQIHWFDALNLATQNLEQPQKNIIAQSPAARIMDKSFIEILKNSIDEAITMHYDSNFSIKPMIQLSLNIDHTSHPDCVSIQIIDSGRGFPESFLSQVRTQQARATYANTSRISNKLKRDNRPYLLGGKGRGLRILIADEDGDTLGHSGQRTHRFIKPEISLVEFANALDDQGNNQGAQITVTTSIAPRQKFVKSIQKDTGEKHLETAHSPNSSLQFSPNFLAQLNVDDGAKQDCEKNNTSPKL